MQRTVSKRNPLHFQCLLNQDFCPEVELSDDYLMILVNWRYPSSRPNFARLNASAPASAPLSDSGTVLSLLPVRVDRAA